MQDETFFSEWCQALSALRSGAVTVGFAVATFVLVTLSVQFWVAAASPSAISAGADTHPYAHPSYAYVTPDPHP